MGKKRKIGLAIGAGVLLSAFLVYGAVAGNKAPLLTVDSVSPVYRDLTQSVTANGQVESKTYRGIYSTQSFPINSVNVQIGDQVNAGDPLAQLETSTLEFQIRQQKAALSAQQSAGSQQVAAAQHTYQNAKFTNDEGLNLQIIQAQAAVDSGELAVRQARSNLSTAQDSSSSGGSGSGRLTGGGGIQTIPPGYSQPVLSGNFTLDGSLPLGGLMPSSGSNENQARIAVDQAETQLAAARKTLEGTLNQAGITLTNYEDALKTARSANNTTAQQIAVQSLEKNLKDATITSPINGTVTAVYAKEGNLGSGLLFVVQDTNALQIRTSVKEFDVLSVSPGTPVIVQSDATGDDKYEGVVESVSPAAIAAADKLGAAAPTTGTDSSFEVIVGITAPSRLLIGMSARLEMVLNQKSDVLSLPFEAITTDDQGRDIVYWLKPSEKKGTYVATATPVTVGLETDYYVEIQSPPFSETDLIANTPDGLSDGAVVTLSETSSSGASSVSSKEASSDSSTENGTSSTPEQALPAPQKEEEIISSEAVPS